MRTRDLLLLPLLLLTSLVPLACRPEQEGTAPAGSKVPPPGTAPPAAAAPASTSPPPSGTAAAIPATPANLEETKDDLNWTAVSPDNQVALIQTGDLRRRCVSECSRTHEKRLLWRAEKCFGTRIDLRFISNDCEKVVVLHQLPRASGIPQQTVVGEVFKRDRRQYVINAGPTIRDWSKVRSGGTTFYWLAGTLGMPGDPPRYSADGQAVELQTVDGTKHSIPLTVTK